MKLEEAKVGMYICKINTDRPIKIDKVNLKSVTCGWDNIKEKELEDYIIVDDDYTQGYFNHDVNIVKQALIKSQEQEKVLEIIKKKHVNVSKFIDMFIFEKGNELRKYNEGLYLYDRITEEEFDLLKRWLECQKD